MNWLAERRRRGQPAQEARRLALLRRQQAAQMVQQAQAAARAARFGRPHPLVAVLLGFALLGMLATLLIVLTRPPEDGRNQLAFRIASGVAVWGLVGLAVVASRRATPARQFGLVAYDALRQGLLVAGCLELNLATRMLDLWTPLVGGLLLAVFALFEVITQSRRPA